MVARLMWALAWAWRCRGRGCGNAVVGFTVDVVGAASVGAARWKGGNAVGVGAAKAGGGDGDSVDDNGRVFF